MEGKIFELQMQIENSEKSIKEHQLKIEHQQKEKEIAEREIHKLLCGTCSAYSKIYDMYLIETSKGYHGSHDKKGVMEDMLKYLKQWLIDEYNPNLFKNKV